jgi:hypothetical protein
MEYFLPERRRHTRTRLSMMLHGIRLDPDGGDVHDTLQMLDISRRGLGALSDRWLYPGQKVLLCLPLHPQGVRRNVYATVVRCAKGADGYRIGLEFDSVIYGASVSGHPAAAAA